MKDQVVRAGKYFSVGILFISCLPVLLPLLFLLSIFGFAFVLPLGCALAGFLYLRKYVGMLYRKLPITIGTCSSWGRRRPLPGARLGPPLFINLPLRYQQAIETFESVDPEFDAVVVSTVPPEEERVSVGSAEDVDTGSGLGAASFADVSADDVTRREGVDADISVKDSTTGEENDDEAIVENGIKREGTGDDLSVENETRRYGTTVSAEKGSRREASDDVSTENRIRTERPNDDTSAENWTVKEGKEVHTFAENSAESEATDDDAFHENETRREVGEDDIFADYGTKNEGIDGGRFAKDANRRAGIDDTSVDVSGGDVTEVNTLSKNRTGIQGQDSTSVDATSGGVRQDTFSNDRIEIQGQDSTSVDETRGDVPEGDISASDGTGTEWKDYISSEEGTRREGKDDVETEEGEDEPETDVENLNEEKMENTMPSAANLEKSFKVPENFGRTSGVQEIEDKGKQNEAHANLDDCADPEVDAVEKGSEEANKASEETTEQKFEAVPKECVSGEVGDDEHSKLVSSAAPDTFHEASEKESPTKPDGLGTLLPHQANEDDIWICKECGWKYPNAKPSAKIRRNHKKHCKASSPRARALEDEIRTERLSQHNDGVPKLRVDSELSSPPADSTPKQFWEGVIEQNSSAVKADDWCAEPSARGVDPTNTSTSDVSRDEPGSITERSSSVLGKEDRVHSSPSPAEDDVTSPGHEHHSKGLDLNAGSSAISSGQSGEHDEESRLESDSFRSMANEFPSIKSESFRSAPDEFPHDRWSSFPSVESHYDDEQDQLAQVQQELQLCDDLNAVKGVVGDKSVSTGPLLGDIEELSEFLGIDLPVKSADLPEIEWAKLAIEVMKVVVGID